jgi:Mg2+ and Co2+ transporter CorA
MQDTIRRIRKLFHRTVSLQTKLLSQITINRFLTMENERKSTQKSCTRTIQRKIFTCSHFPTAVNYKCIGNG